MIVYKFGEIPCKIDFKDFLSITTDIKKYKSEFEDISMLYEYIEHNLNKITHILFDNYEYNLEKGLLHNLYGPALIRHHDGETSHLKGTFNWFYIDGKLVCNELNTRGCNSIEKFNKDDIFHYEELTNIPQNSIDPFTGNRYRRRDGIDYKKTYINLEQRIKLDQRKKKIQYINNVK